MAKKGNFGIVSVKSLNSLALLCFLLLGCSSEIIDGKQAVQNWQERFEYCDNIAEQNKLPFPDSIWFKSLSLSDKKTVVGYIANYNDRQCMRSASEILKRSLTAENNTQLLDYYSVDLTPLDVLAAERIRHLDKSKILKLQEQYSHPFNLRFVIEEQNLYPKK